MTGAVNLEFNVKIARVFTSYYLLHILIPLYASSNIDWRNTNNVITQIAISK